MGSGMNLPSFAKARKGGLSVPDAMVAALWTKGGGWPCLSISALTEQASRRVGYNVPAPTVRSILSRKERIFRRVLSGSRPAYELTSWARKQGK